MHIPTGTSKELDPPEAQVMPQNIHLLLEDHAVQLWPRLLIQSAHVGTRCMQLDALEPQDDAVKRAFVAVWTQSVLTCLLLARIKSN